MTQSYSVKLGAPFPAAAGTDARTVTVTPLPGDRYEVRIGDGPAEVVEARRVFAGLGTGPGAATWSLLCGPEGGARRQHLVDVEGTAPDLKVAVASGEPVALKLLDARAQALLAVPAGPAPTGPTDVRAPMPGKVVKVLCQVGQPVKAGQGLLIIEAMKMENELRAPGDGVVRAIAAAEGQTVEGGMVVVSLGAGTETGGPPAGR